MPVFVRIAATLGLIWLLGSLTGMPARAQPQPVKIALVIGNQGYDRSVGELTNPHNDVALVAAALQKQGFRVLPPVKEARRSVILGAVRELVRQLNAAPAGAIGFLYYSGHGASESDTGFNYLIPIDAKDPGAATFWDDSLKLDDVLKLLDGAKAAAKFVVFDACRNELRVPSKSTSKGLMPVAEQQGMFIAYASAPGRTASDRGAGSGPYAAALAAELLKPGQDHLNLFQNVKEAVIASTGGVQQPWFMDGLVRRIYPTGEPRRQEPPADGSAADVVRLCREISGITSPATLAALERQHKGTPVADCISARLGELLQAVARADEQAKAAAARQKADEDAKAKADAERQRVALLQKQEDDRRRTATAAEAAKQETAAAAKRKADEEAAARAKAEAEAKERAEAAKRDPAAGVTPGSGQSFRDCPDCPEMVVVPAGSFMMGSPASETGRDPDEGPQRRVTLARPFAVGKFEVTFAEWEACFSGGGCQGNRAPSDQGWGKGRRPVINVSWDDAKQYVDWLSRRTGKAYRLLTEAEWEYAARAGTTTPFSFGATISTGEANYDGNYTYGGGRKGVYRQKTIEVGSLGKPNAWGLHDMHGNVWEWVEDCYSSTYSSAPADGSKAPDINNCSRVLRGGSWGYNPQLLRSAYRSRDQPVNRYGLIGFRLARTL